MDIETRGLLPMGLCAPIDAPPCMGIIGAFNGTMLPLPACIIGHQLYNIFSSHAHSSAAS